MSEKEKTQREKDIEKMIKEGNMSLMTECAYGEGIAHTQTDKKIKK